MLNKMKVTALAILAQFISYNYASAEEFVSYCKMDTCRWFKAEKREIVGSSPEGKLLKLQYKEWESYHPNAAYNKKFPRTEIGTAPAYMFCSKAKPAVIFQTDAKPESKTWNVYLLYPRAEAAIGGVNLLSYMLYFNACHGTNFERKEISFAKLAKKLGYPDTALEEDDTYVTDDPMTLLGSKK